jgi:hypothetical protein
MVANQTLRTYDLCKVIVSLTYDEAKKKSSGTGYTFSMRPPDSGGDHYRKLEY